MTQEFPVSGRHVLCDRDGGVCMVVSSHAKSYISGFSQSLLASRLLEQHGETGRRRWSKSVIGLPRKVRTSGFIVQGVVGAGDGITLLAELICDIVPVLPCGLDILCPAVAADVPGTGMLWTTCHAVRRAMDLKSAEEERAGAV